MMLTIFNVKSEPAVLAKSTGIIVSKGVNLEQ